MNETYISGEIRHPRASTGIGLNFGELFTETREHLQICENLRRLCFLSHHGSHPKESGLRDRMCSGTSDSDLLSSLIFIHPNANLILLISTFLMNSLGAPHLSLPTQAVLCGSTRAPASVEPQQSSRLRCEKSRWLFGAILTYPAETAKWLMYVNVMNPGRSRDLWDNSPTEEWVNQHQPNKDSPVAFFGSSKSRSKSRSNQD